MLESARKNPELPASAAKLQLEAAIENADFARSESARLRKELESGRNIAPTESPLVQNADVLQLQAVCKDQATQIQVFKEIETIFRGRNTIQTEELRRMGARCAELENTVLEQKQQITVLHQLLNSQETRSAVTEKANEKKSLQLDRQEEQLRLYADSLTNTRNEVKEFSRDLVQDIQATRSMHPLKDYLALTEFELSKVELQVKKTPTFSTDRPKLEACLQQLHEQRDFLKSVIEASLRENEQRASIIQKIADSQKLPAIPPAPPNPARIAKARGQELEEN